MKATKGETTLLAGPVTVVAGLLMGGPWVSNANAANVRNDDKFQQKLLNATFQVIKRKDNVRVFVRYSDRAYVFVQRSGKVYFFLSPYPLKVKERGPRTRDLRIGSQFRTGARHHSYNYQVKTIDADGIRIRYAGYRNEDPKWDLSGAVRGDVAGEVKLKWKP